VHVVWPVFSGSLTVQMVLGCIVGLLRAGAVGRLTLYFTFITGLTIGYGDVVPRTVAGRPLSILLTGLVVAVGVKALNAVAETDRSRPHDH
jgi:hypothetical protein